jgi:hypothetical protein
MFGVATVGITIPPFVLSEDAPKGAAEPFDSGIAFGDALAQDDRGGGALRAS